PESLGRNNRSDEVDVHLAAEFVGGQFEYRARDRNAGIVDQAGERFAVESAADLARGGQHRRLVGDIEDQRREVRAELALKAVGVGLLAHAAEHAEAAIKQQFGTGPADAGRRAGDDNRSHDLSPCERFNEVRREGMLKRPLRELPPWVRPALTASCSASCYSIFPGNGLERIAA